MTNYELRIAIEVVCESSRWSLADQEVITSIVFDGTRLGSEELSFLGRKCAYLFSVKQMGELRNFLQELMKLQQFFA